MGDAAQKGATYEDLFHLPEHHVGQIVEGVLYSHPRPAFPHAIAASVLGSDLGTPFHRGRGGPGGWVILLEPELHLGRDILVPDLAGWRRERMPQAPDTAFTTLSPDWVCEVLSPSTAQLDRVKKMPVYARESASESDEGKYVPFDAITLELAALWAR
jgi:Uma2 family endonuclease